MTHTPMDDRMRALNIAADLKDVPEVQQWANSWLERNPLKPEPSFLELSQPSEK